MSQAEEDAVVGRLAREHSEQEELIVKLEADARNFALKLRSLADCLSRDAASVIFPGQPNLLEGLGSNFEADPSVLSLDRIKTLVDNLRTAIAKRNECSTSLHKLGIKV